MQVRDKLQAGLDAAKRFAAWLDPLAAKTWFRLAVAVLFAVFHLTMFVQAGHSRIDRPFNNAPGEPPEFGNPDAPATRIFPREPHNWSRLIVARWDSQHYIGTATRGLTACPTDGTKATDLDYLDCGLGWLPAYGMVGNVVSRATGIPDDYALVFVSVLCALVVSMLWTSKTIVDRMGRFEAYATLVAFHAFPTAFYIVTPYTEVATLALVLGGFIALSKDRWVLAGLLIGASTALRVSTAAFAMALGCSALVAAWRNRKAGKARWWRPLLCLPLCGWGMAVESIALKFAVGDAMAFWRARHAFGDKHDYTRLTSATYFLTGYGAQHLDVVMFTAMIAILALTLREVLKKFPPEQVTFLVVASFVTLALVVVAPLRYWGMNRYLLLCPLPFFGMGVMARKHTVLYLMWIALCLAFYWHIELCSYVAQGNPQICPCLGRYEFGMPF